jgi:tRNA pseudouridine32 synthase/23S rRNA pseudouridine746 synthase
VSNFSDTDRYIHRFHPQPGASELPAIMPSPFSGALPHPLAVRAAAELKEYLRAHSEELPHDFSEKHRGKMFGVLVVQTPSGDIGYLKGFSGLLGDQWLVRDFVPPIFDLPTLNSFWPEEKSEIYRLNREIEALAKGDERQALVEQQRNLEAQLNHEWSELDTRHREQKKKRHANREALEKEPDSSTKAASLAQLADESWNEKNERNRFKRRKREALNTLKAKQSALDVRKKQLAGERAERCAIAQEKILGCYRLENFEDESIMLEELFEPFPPPGGAGDCAAPKLIAYACRSNLKPLALAEFWWGRGSAGGERHHGAWYPSCRSKCEPILPWMLKGTPVEPAPIFGAAATPDDEPATVYEDEHLVIVNKPAGMLSVPGRNQRLDSVQKRLAERYPDATGPLLVHRLDMDTSGLLVMAKTLDVYRAMQRLFSERHIEKQYTACLDGIVDGEEGSIELPMRLDYEHRPRQIVDHASGRAAVTRWKVLSRIDGQTRIAFYPETGRTHQLRVHSAHHEGLGCSIVGDPLYGRPAQRMLLHAASLRFIHPISGEAIEVVAEAPF